MAQTEPARFFLPRKVEPEGDKKTRGGGGGGGGGGGNE